MKKLLLLILFLECLSYKLSSQCQGPLVPATKIENAHRVNVISHGGNLKNELSGKHVYKLKDGNNFDLGFARGIWAGALDPSGNLKLAISIYPQNKNVDFGNGPLIPITSYDEERCLFFNRAWTINQYQVVKMISDFEKGTILIDSIPKDIREWPAIGNPYIGRFAPTEDCAPFYDNNGDLRYDPLDGDYPIALVENPTFIPYQFRFMIYNDNEIHRQSFGERLSMEFRQIDYVINCTEESVSEHAVFTRLTCINKGVEDLRDFKLGIWDDQVLGCSPSNYVGCRPELDCSFVYKKDGVDKIDNSLSCLENENIPENLGVISCIVAFNKRLKSHMVVTQDLSTALSMLSTKAYVLLSGTWEDGTPVTVGGTGINPGSQDTTKFAFDGRPDLSNEWSMQAENTPRGRYNTVSTFTNENLQPGESVTLDYADYIIVDEDKVGLTVFENMEESVSALKKVHADLLVGSFDCGNTISPVEEIDLVAQGNLSLYPNPTNENVTVEFEEIVRGTFTVYSIDGTRVANKKIDGLKRLTLDVNDFSEGFYVVAFSAESGTITSSYFVKE